MNYRMIFAILAFAAVCDPAIACVEEGTCGTDPEPEPEPEPTPEPTPEPPHDDDSEPWVIEPTPLPCCIRNGEMVAKKRLFVSAAKTLERCERERERGNALIYECPGLESPEALK